MAQKTTVVLIDDLDGGEANESVSFGLDGVEYTIDLSAKHAQGLRDSLADYVAGGRRLGVRRAAAPSRGRQSSTVAHTNTKEMNNKIREWARGQSDLTVSNRGRISMDVVRQYNEAHPGLF